MFFVLYDNWKTLMWDFSNRHIIVFFKTNVLKEVRILSYVHNNSAVLILMLMLSSKIELSYTIKNLPTWLFYGNVFYTLNFLTWWRISSRKIRSLWIYVKGSLEPKLILFDYIYCAIILLMGEIIVFYNTNNSTHGLLTELKIRFSLKSFFKFLILLT